MAHEALDLQQCELGEHRAGGQFRLLDDVVDVFGLAVDGGNDAQLRLVQPGQL